MAPLWLILIGVVVSGSFAGVLLSKVWNPELEACFLIAFALFAVEAGFSQFFTRSLGSHSGYILVGGAFCGILLAKKNRYRRLHHSHFPNPKGVSLTVFEKEMIHRTAQIVDSLGPTSLLDPRRLYNFLVEPHRLSEMVSMLETTVKFAKGIVLLRVNLPLALDHLYCRSREDLQVVLATSVTANFCPEVKAQLLHAMMKIERMRLARCVGTRSLQEYAVDIITQVEDKDDMVLIMNLLDSRGTRHSFYKLVFLDIRQESLRDKVLAHLQQILTTEVPHPPSSDSVADAGSGSQPLLDKEAQVHQRTGALKIMSDIDDTFACSGGHWPAGVDKRFPPKAVYPGITAVFSQLNKFNNQSSNDSMPEFSNLVFLSARPHIYGDMSEAVSYKAFVSLIKTNGLLDSMPSLMTGTIKGSGFAVLKACLGLRNPWKPMGEVKYQGIKDYSRLHPDCRLVFFGDNGQGDVWAAEKAMDDGLLQAAFIHEVQDVKATTTTLTCSPEGRQEEWRKRKIFFARSPVAAAACAKKEIDLLDIDGLKEICLAAKESLKAQIHHSSSFDWKRRLEEHNEDVRLADCADCVLHEDDLPQSHRSIMNNESTV